MNYLIVYPKTNQSKPNLLYAKQCMKSYTLNECQELYTVNECQATIIGNLDIVLVHYSQHYGNCPSQYNQGGSNR